MLRISVSHALPLRPRPLDAREMQSVFGGCNGVGGSCTKTEQCCPSNSGLIVIQCSGGIGQEGACLEHLAHSL